MPNEIVDALGATLLGDVARALIWLLTTWGWVVVPALVLVVILIFSLRYIAKGAGQYGIIEGYVGTIGAGKTTLAVQHSLALARARNAVLLSNIPVVCGPDCKGRLIYGRNRGLYGVVRGVLRLSGVARWLPFRLPPNGEVLGVGPAVHSIEHAILPVNDDGLDLPALTRWAFKLRDEERGLVLLMDEVGVIMPARQWKDFSVALSWVLQQSRKLACEWIWTAQDTSFVDHQLRSLTSVVHYVRSYPPPSIWRRAKGKRPWFLIASTFTPTAAPRANGEGMRAERKLGTSRKRYKRMWEAAFDTDGVVLPSKHLKGAEVLISAVAETRDRHVIDIGTSNWGESGNAGLAPGQVETPVGPLGGQ